jgi:aminoglycoside phosphotransferase family enzyme/predicted kinase
MTPAAETQDEVFAFLGDPATHGGDSGGAPVKRIDTHAASVFLAGARALKVKRAVRFAFLDYSTLEKRRAACEAELAVNRPFAPQIYLRVMAITREPGGTLALDGKGEPVEWAVEMRRFDDGALLSDLAGKGRIDAALADALGRVVAESHARAPIVDPAPWLAALRNYVDDNDAAFRSRPDLFPTTDVEALTQASRAAWTRLCPLLENRGRHGLVRRGHGDLHLGNIVLIDGKPVLFDAIEFDPVIASGDVLYDLAFLLMDLVERGLTTAANIVLNRYLAETRRVDDLDALAALPFFLSLRAAIRAKVTAARLDKAAPADAPDIARAARTYFDLAQRLIAPPAARLVAVGGLSGTGKSVLARMLARDLAPAPGAVLLRSDVERKAMLSMPETGHLPASGYASDVTAKVYATLADKAERIVEAGHSVVVDAVFARPEERNTIVALAATAGVAFTGLFLTADLDTRIARVGSRTHDASDANAQVARLQDDYDIGALEGWRAIDASGTPAETLARARAELRD